MPAAVPILNSAGIALAIVSRIGVIGDKQKQHACPEDDSSAACHQTFCVRMMVKVKKALMPMPGATANGSFCVEAHQQRHRKTDQDRGGQYAAESHAGSGS